VIPLALHCAAALALSGLPDDAPTAASSAADAPAEVAPSSSTTPPERSTPRPNRLLYRGGPIPEGYHLVDEYSPSLLIGGMTSLVFGYTGGIIFGLVAGLQSLAQIQRGDPLFALLPVIGPFLALGGPGYRNQLPPDLRYVRDVFCLLDGATQLLGVGLASFGYFFPTRWLLLKEEEGGGTGWLVPMGPGGGPGLTWAVTFGP
jgi:hypothetical protein